MTQRGFELRSQLLGPLSIINRFLDRLGVEFLLEQALEADPRSWMPPAKALGVVTRRPKLKQLLWMLTVSADGAVSVHYRVAYGTTEDT